MRALVVGLGSIGTRHINNLYRLGITDLCAYRRRNKNTPTKLLAPTVDLYDDYDKALSTSPDMVIVSNPTAYHLDTAFKAIKAGCNVYIEKPLSHILEGVDELVEISRTKCVVCMIGCQLRFDPTLIRIKEWLDGGKIGRVLTAQVDVGEYLPGWHPWEDYRDSYAASSEMGGGVILTLIHEIDYLYWFFGMPGTIYGVGGKMTPLEMDVEDTALITMAYPTGITCQLRVDYWRKPAVRRFNIVGEEGELEWDYYEGRATFRGRGGEEQTHTRHEGWDRNDMFLGAMRNFIEAVRSGVEPEIPLEEGVDVLKIALAAKESIVQKRILTI